MWEQLATILLNVDLEIKWARSRENVSSGNFHQVRVKPGCSTTETSYNLETLDIASIHIILSKKRTTKVLIRQRGCAGWSAPLLFAYVIRHIFTWPGLNVDLKTVALTTGNSHLSCRTTKPTKWYVRPAKTQISLGIRPVWSESSLSTWRKLGSLATH